ncbi:MAG: amidohydrolase family protein [Desulfitobacteriaceae bacterium]
MINKSYPSDFDLIIDVHCHMGYFRNFQIPFNDVHGMIKEMDSYGIDIACVTHHAGISSDFRLGNDTVAEAIRLYPNRIVGYCTINPNFPAEIGEELTRCIDVYGFRAIKVHPELHDDYPLDGRNYRPMWEFAAARSLPLLSHTYFAGDSLEVFRNLANEYPTVTILLGHLGFDKGLDRAIDLVLECPNIVLDLTGPVQFAGVVEKVVKEAGVDRVVYGSDIPFRDAATQLGNILYADLTREQKEKILGLNTKRIFKL